MFTLLRNSIKVFKNTYKKLLVFQLVYMALTSFIFVPSIAYIFNRILWSMGSESLLNKEVLKIGLRYEGILGIIIICVIIVVVMFIEFGVIIIISQKRYYNQDVSISDSIITTFVKTPKLFSFGILQLVLLFILIIPLIDSPLLSTFSENVNFQIFFNSNLERSNLFWLLYAIVFLIILYIILRWIFTLHFIIIENKSARKAIKSSLALTKKNKTRIVFNLLLFNIIVFGIGIALISSIVFIPSYFNISTQTNLLGNYLITLSSYMTIILTLLVMPINLIFITSLYYKFLDKDGTQKDILKIYSSRTLNKLEKRLAGFFQKRKYLIILLLILYLTVTFLLNYSVTEGVLRWNVQISSHRGDSEGPENSISSIKNAINKNVDAIEIDVQMTKDSVLVLNHDVNLKRVAGVPYKVSDLTYNKLLRIDIGSNYSKEYEGERIPTLEEVLIEVRGKAKLIIDIKPYGSVEELATGVVRLIEKYDMEEDCYIQSFNYKLLQEVRSLNEDIRIGQILYIAAGDLSSLDVDFYTIRQSMLSNSFVKKAHKDDREVWVWTVNSESNIKEVLKYKIDGIITDFPERVQRQLLRRKI